MARPWCATRRTCALSSAGRSAAAAPPSTGPPRSLPTTARWRSAARTAPYGSSTWTPARQRTALGRHAAEVFGARFTPDGRTLVTTGADGDVILWDVAAGGRQRDTVRATRARPHAPDHARRQHPLHGRPGRRGVHLGPRRDSAPRPAVHHRRTQLPTRPSRRLARSGVPRAQLRRPPDREGSRRWRDQHRRRAHAGPAREPFPVVTAGPVHGLGFVPGSHLLVVTGNRSGLLRAASDSSRLADADRGRVLELTGQAETVLPPAISADGRLLVTASDDAARSACGRCPTSAPVGGPLLFDRDGRRRAGQPRRTPADRRARRPQTARAGHSRSGTRGSRRRVTRLPVPDTPTAVRFSPDGRLLAVGYPHGRVASVVDRDLEAGHAPARRRCGDIHALAISPNGRTLATGSEDRTVRLWDIETQQAIGAPLPGPGRGVGTVAPYFTPRRRSAHRQLRHRPRLPLGHPARALARHACQVAGRRLTRAEWTEFLPGRDYAPAC